MLRSALVTATLLALAAPAAAQDGAGAGGGSDRLSGYRCVDKSCLWVRIPNSNCICQKLNPGVTQLSKLRLKCTTKEGGRWVACPVKPRYGISVD